MIVKPLVFECPYCEWTARQQVEGLAEVRTLARSLSDALVAHVTSVHGPVTPAGRTATFVVRLTPSQRMALLDVITAVMVPPLQMEVYVDVTSNVETTPGELVRLVLGAEVERS
jgi:hypothetical protein